MTDPVLRAPEARDIAALAELINGDGVYPWTTRPPFTTEAWAAEQAPAPAGTHGIVAEIDGTARGWASLALGVGRRAHTGEIGVAVHDRYQRQGLGRAMLVALLDVADNWLGLQRVSLTVNADNAGAIGLYRFLGFEDEARLRAEVIRDGVLVDNLTMGRLRPALERATQ